MNPLALVLLTPVAAGVILGFIPGRYHRIAARLNVLASFVTLVSSLTLFELQPGRTSISSSTTSTSTWCTHGFVGFTTSVFSASYIEHEVEIGRLDAARLRFYHGMYQAFMFSMLLALTANNLGIMWVAVEGATLATALMVSLYRTREAIEAAWKYFILCGVGIALALFGTILMYLAAQPVMGGGAQAMAWQLILAQVGGFDPAILNLAFVFLLAGYGTKVGLAPFHAWLPDAHAEGPTPISAVLSGLLLNVALYAVLRFKILLAHNAGAIAPGPLMIGMGLSSLLLAAFMLYRRRDIKRLFAYSSIEHRASSPSPSAWAGRSPTHGVAARDHAQPHQVGDLLLGRPYRAGEGLAEDRRHPRAHRQPPHARAGPSSSPCWQSPDCRPSASSIASFWWSPPPWRAAGAGDPARARTLVGFGALILRLQGAAFGDVPTRAMHRSRRRCCRVGASRPGGDRRPLHPVSCVAWFRAVATLLG
jgi:hypothetical protein